MVSTALNNAFACGRGGYSEGRPAETERRISQALSRYSGAGGEVSIYTDGFADRWFWTHVDTNGGDDVCWPWMGRLDAHEYGVFDAGGARLRAHRYAHIVTVGRVVGADVMVCHRCNNRACCNPAHLYEGDAQSNALDLRARRAGTRALLASIGFHGVPFRLEPDGTFCVNADDLREHDARSREGEPG